MNRQRLSRPSLKITRLVDHMDLAFTVTVWNPFIGAYQPVASVQDGVQRLGDLAGIICQMWLQRHPKQNDLTDVPAATDDDHAQWAEFRVNPTTYRSYDTRRHDRPAWARAVGMAEALELTCGRIGYALPATAA